MALDFPSSPTVGQQYPSPPVLGVPTYTWDGEKWVGTTAGPALAVPLMDAVAAVGVSQKYAREDHVHPSDTSRIMKTGDTMTGHLSLPAGPAAANAVRKDYVDAADAGKLPFTGGTMTGVINTAGCGGAIGGAVASRALNVFNSAGGAHSFLTFTATGFFIANFGLANDGNLYLGGMSHGAAAYRIYTTRDAAPVSNGRLVYAGDFSVSSSMLEPYTGAVATGMSASFGAGADTFRFRYMQLFTTGWFTVGYA